MITFETLKYKGWGNNARLANGIVELIITGDVGPRIIRFGFMGQDNEFAEYPDQLGKVGGDEWRIYGGHRLWHAPEDTQRTYFPDNQPVSIEQQSGFVRVTQPTEPTTGIQKEMDIRLAPDSAHVQIVHRLINHNLWSVEFAPWALSVMAAGGTGIFPLPPRGSHPQNLLPGNSLVLWTFTDMSDPRWTWGRKYILLRQNSNPASPQKVGLSVPDGWAAYARNNHLFVKTYEYRPDGRYPDLGCSIESFTNADMLEVETLSPLTALVPGASVEHKENWYLFDKVSSPSNDNDVERNILPLVQTVIPD